MAVLDSSLKEEIRGIGGDFAPATEEDVRQAEKFVGGRFPEPFRQLLLQFGSFMFKDEAWVSSKAYEVLAVFGCTGDRDNLVIELKTHPELHRQGLVPFARDSFGNFWTLHLRSGAIRFVEWTGSQETKRMAGSFEEFFAMIRTESNR